MQDIKISEGNKLIAEFMGYYQPKEEQDNLFSFEVYYSRKRCRKDFPEKEVSTYYGEDIEDHAFVDDGKFHSSWDWLMPVVNKIRSLYNNTAVDHNDIIDDLAEGCIEANIIQVWTAVVEFIKWYNNERKGNN